jgi:uncharacterized protein (DUF169 family)
MTATKDPRLNEFLQALGHMEEPMGMFYSEDEPQDGVAPKAGILPTAEQEAKNQVDFNAVWKDFSCVVGKIWIARNKRTAAYFDREHFGCLGGAFFLGYLKPQLNAIVHYVSTGLPNILDGERYFSDPDVARAFYQTLDPRPAPKRFCIFKPLSTFAESEQPEVVVFFARPEAISGLHQLAVYVTKDLEVVMSPMGAGCTNIVTWPIKYLEQGKLKAVLGGWDPSERRYLKPDEITFAVPFALYQRMLDEWKESFLTAEAWQTVLKRIERSRKAWKEDKD